MSRPATCARRAVPEGARPLPGATIALAVALLTLACGDAGGPPLGPEPAGDVRWSLLAIGDTGDPPNPWRPDRLERLAAGLDAAARRRRVDALVLLGDNFYPRGLEEHELAARVAANVVAPLCRFVDLSGPRSPEVADACALPAAERRPVPIFAVLGNHDYRSGASPSLQTRVLPRFVANWRMPGGTTRVYGVAEGVSLVLLQSMPMVRRPFELTALTRALRDAPGPWRILAAHHPVAPTAEAHGEFEARYLARAREAIERSGVPVQLALGGHHHALQIYQDGYAGAPLQVVSGAGSRSVDAPVARPGLHFASDHNGFARIDLVASGGEERLVVSLYAAAPLWWPAAPARLEARWSVGLDGRARDELPTAVP